MIASGITLEPGEDGTLPVRVKWFAEVDLMESIASDGDRVYMVGSEIAARDLDNGDELWNADPPDDWVGWGSDGGGVEIGRDATDDIIVFVPYEYSVAVDPENGDVVQFDPNVDETMRGFHKLSATAPADYTFARTDSGEYDDSHPVAYNADRTRAWSIAIDEPAFATDPPFEVDGTIIVPLTSGHVVALERV